LPEIVAGKSSASLAAPLRSISSRLRKRRGRGSLLDRLALRRRRTRVRRLHDDQTRTFRLSDAVDQRHSHGEHDSEQQDRAERNPKRSR
jgi:hypothetical protein